MKAGGEARRATSEEIRHRCKRQGYHSSRVVERLWNHLARLRVQAISMNFPSVLQRMTLEGCDTKD